MFNFRLKEFVSVICIILLSGCLAGVPTKEVEGLNTEVNTYGKLIRWRAYDDAAAYIRSKDGEVVNIDTTALKEFRVTDYDVLTVQMDESGTMAQATAEISYYHERVNAVHTIVDNQQWWKDEETGRWFIDGRLPAFVP